MAAENHPTAAAPRPFLRILLGPTCSGKERLALACAERLGGEIVSVDSMKLYRGLDVGTAKPAAADRARVPHHCLDLVDPGAEFSVARYLEAAEAAIAAIAARGRPVVLSGGSALYYKALLEGLFPGPGADPEVRAVLREQAAQEGPEVLHARLAELDPAAAARIHPRDLRRLVRALEVHSLTGRPIGEWQQEWQRGARDTTAGWRYPAAVVGLDWPREELYRRIHERVDRMLAAGLLEEARGVYERRAELGRTPLQAVGYKEFFPYFAGELPLAEAVELLKKNTRHLAKSQLTWFRKFPVAWLPMSPELTPEAAVPAVLRRWDEARPGV